MDGILRAAERHVFKMFVINGNNRNNAGELPIFIRTYISSYETKIANNWKAFLGMQYSDNNIIHNF